MSIGYHVTLRLSDDRVLATTTEARRALARVILQQGTLGGLLVFGAADNHVHLEMVCSRAVAGEAARRIEIGLHRRLRLAVPFAPARVRPIESQRHLANCFRYVLRQDEHHGTRSDPFFEASSLPDLLGLRVVGLFTIDHVRAHLPRIQRSELVPVLGGGDLEHGPVDMAHLADAAAAAVALPDLRRRSREAHRVRVAAVHAARGHATVRAVGEALGLTERGVYGLRAKATSAVLVRAVARQLRWRTAARSDPWEEGRARGVERAPGT